MHSFQRIGNIGPLPLFVDTDIFLRELVLKLSILRLKCSVDEC